MAELEPQKAKNNNTIDVKIQLYSLPSIDNAEKVIRYEKAIQKSILQNLAVLKKLQSIE